MNHSRRGVAAIFNQEVFEDCRVKRRLGGEEDCISLTWTFNSLGFEVELYKDLRLVDIKERLNDLSSRDHSDCDCFILTFMTHGRDGQLRSHDTAFDINLLWDMFTSEQCPSLANKPKVFIIQACQGNKIQGGVTVYKENENLETETHDGPVLVKLLPSYRLPRGADFLIALSTMPGFGSWRNKEIGSPYILSLCHNLESEGYDLDMVTLLTRVSNVVALYTGYYDEKTSSIKTQMPSFISLLLRQLKFTRKLPKRKILKREEYSGDEEGEDGRSKSHKGGLDSRWSKRKRPPSREHFYVNPSRKKTN